VQSDAALDLFIVDGFKVDFTAQAIRHCRRITNVMPKITKIKYL
jgi:hypothetical protein